ncbi:Acyl-CoA hydrolase [Dethiosulfatibacter aminovorans DSM 17477]|uniref:Acyl-CoA hydrolase n=1 Tax=Dethiosulfatibacter aminovorans DSM 17477 TaxID=1121476 RepID=A0A1M6MAY2_9FIRM|nr:acetyl-CoA hydrolase/transferase C-terminal domain-containing protein [Dethiosulfatibacter aminovorans]SHJ80638.1 Acyl-CoA hydrolase [Dethiosulfatibacter aminovorans DSM 17477]
MSWKQTYNSKLVSVKEAASKIESGDKIWFAPISAAPVQLIEAITDRVDELENVDMMSGLLLHPFKFLQDPKYIGRINYHTVFYGPCARAFYDVGNVNINSVHLSKLDKVFIEEKPNVLLADVSLPDEDGYLYYGSMGVSTNGLVSELAEKIIVQVNKNQPKVKGTKHRIHVSEVDYICEFDHELVELPQPEVSEIDKKIAAHILPLITDGSTIQIGLGGLANAIGYGLVEKKNLAVHTEMFTDSMVYLAKKGVITGKMFAGFGLGNRETYEFIGEGKVELAPIYEVNNPYEVGKNDKFISINAGLMADLTGQVCSESLGFKQYSSTGGALDFVRGAGISKGGKSFICIPSTNTSKDGKLHSTIDVSLPPGAIVTIPRTDTMFIATEYGVADLSNKPIEERVKALVSIAHPDFREELLEKAKSKKIIK